MKITALVTTLVLGISSAAIASPSSPSPASSSFDERDRVVDHRADARLVPPPAPLPAAPVIRDHGERDAPGDRRPGRAQPKAWTTLATASSLGRGKTQIDVATTARFSTLKLEATRGATMIDRIVIMFANGERQVVRLGQTISRGNAATIDLDGRARQITKIVVQGRGNYRASYARLAV